MASWHRHQQKGINSTPWLIMGGRMTTYPMLIIFLTCLTGQAINPGETEAGCRCIRFTSTFGKDWGTFSSPDYPLDYPSGIRCLLYSFQAPRDFIVQVRLEHIHLPIYPNGCHSGDYMKIFLHLEDQGVNEETPWNSMLCGEKSNETYFSASRNLIFQFHSSSSPNRPSPFSPSSSTSVTKKELLSESAKKFGFHGFFRFLNSSQFESNGRLVAGTKCDFRFESNNYSSPEGTFFSPYYPSNYPHNIMCAYNFHAKSQERVKIVFESVELEPELYSCLNKTDIIRVVDGPSSRSPVISLVCNSVQNYEIVSTGPDLLVEFIGNSDNPGMGFRAKFRFIKVIYDDPYDPTRFNLQQYFPKLDIQKQREDGLPQASTLVPQCDSVISSDNGPNGSVSSPNYPNPYQLKSHCWIDFIGHGRQRVHISFVDFDLFHSTVDEGIYTGTMVKRQQQPAEAKEWEIELSERNCAFSDIIAAYSYINGVRTKILEYCGPNPPPDFMSSGHRLTLEFHAKGSKQTPSVRGFYSQYAFVEDYALTSGTQLVEYPCAFVFNISVFPNGTISSPNHPGLYPRNTECHYFFHGDNTNRVQLHFNHFDISTTTGSSSSSKRCTSEKDDYLELSNYMPTDPRFSRKCGKNLSNFAVGADGKFFRLTFRSNDGWGDGTGFKASYTFTNKINQFSIVNVNCSTRPKGVLGTPGSLILVLLFLFGNKLCGLVLHFGNQLYNTWTFHLIDDPRTG